MEIIPVIDVMGGKVVHASGAKRADYPLLTSILTKSHDPITVILDLLTCFAVKIVYIADLDAIMTAKRNEQLYCALSQAYPQLDFYLDAGVTDKTSWQKLLINANVYPVIATETLLEIDWLADVAVQEQSILSLDFKHGEFLGDKRLLNTVELWPQHIIAMNLDCIGSQLGPDLTLLSDLSRRSTRNIIAAGGVRSEQDLLRLQQQGIKQVLIASALHDGRITKQIVNSIKANS